MSNFYPKPARDFFRCYPDEDYTAGGKLPARLRARRLLSGTDGKVWYNYHFYRGRSACVRCGHARPATAAYR